MAEQEKREKVIKGLEHEMLNRGKCGHYCSEGKETVCCDYDKNRLCIQHWGQDAIALLKEQKPRALGIVEICNIAREGDNIVWCERRPGGDDLCASGWARLKEGLDPIGRPKLQVLWPGSEVNDTPIKANYEKTWVCFTGKPSDEQRKAVKWK